MLEIEIMVIRIRIRVRAGDFRQAGNGPHRAHTDVNVLNQADDGGIGTRGTTGAIATIGKRER